MKGENNMKKLLIFLFLCLLALTSCGKRTVNAHGKIIARETDENGRLISVVADTETNGTIRLILMENTHLDVPACFSEKDFLTDDSLYPFISTVYDARTGKNDTYENRKIRCYEAELIDMDIEKNNTPASTITLSDGTELRVYPDSDHTLYALANGTDLLLENHPQTPENTMAVGKKNIDHLEENAKAAVLAYYEERGRLYDIMEELEKASAIYQQSQNKENFSMMRIEQNVYPTAANDRLIFFQTSLHLPLAEKTFTERNLCEVFDRKTGAYIPIEDLFICPLEELGSQLLALAHLSDADRADMEAAFRREYIFFTEDSLCIDFPAGSLTNYKEQYIVPLKYTSDLRGLMHDWAIPKEDNKKALNKSNFPLRKH